MKKKILFVIDSLGCAGAEKSLISLLNLLDYEKNEVDLQLLSYNGKLQSFVPKEVNILPPISYFLFLTNSLIRHLISFKMRSFISRIRYSYIIRRYKLSHPQKAVVLWKCASKMIYPPVKKKYDVAIAYAQGVPTFYVSDKIIADKKYAWVNVALNLQGDLRNQQYHFYSKMTGIVCVSDTSYQVFQKVYPCLKDKMYLIWDIIDPSFIQRLSSLKLKKPLMDKNIPSILTVARLNKDQKGYDISLKVANILKERGVQFHWYALGKGDYKDEMLRYIKKHHLEKHFIFLGITDNPYPYFKECTLYVQTSRHEGYGLSIAEARLLNKPVVTTEFDSVYDQMIHGKNGLVTSFEPSDIADAIELLLQNRELYDSIVEYQKTEKKGNTEELEKFYALINS